MDRKPELEVVFAAILAKSRESRCSGYNISVAMGLARLIFHSVVQFMDLNICVKFQRHSSRASYFSHGSRIKMPGVKYAPEAIFGHIYLDV